MNTPLPKPTLHQALTELRHRDEFRVVLDYIREEREKFFGDLRMAETANDVMKITGSVATLDELLQQLQ